MKKFLSLPLVLAFVPEMERRGVSVVARSPRGFLAAYRKARGRVERLDASWIARREAFLARHMAQLIRNDEPLYRGKMPTRRHLALVAWAYSPEQARLVRLAREL